MSYRRRIYFKSGQKSEIWDHRQKELSHAARKRQLSPHKLPNANRPEWAITRRASDLRTHVRAPAYCIFEVLHGTAESYAPMMRPCFN